MSLLAACGGSDSSTDPRVAGLSEFHQAVAGHRLVGVFVEGTGGSRLAACVYPPAEGGVPFPTVVMRTPDDRDGGLAELKLGSVAEWSIAPVLFNAEGVAP